VPKKKAHNLPYTPEWLARKIDGWIEKKHSKQNNKYTINKNNIYILPSKSGWLFILSLLAILAGAINYNNSLAYMLCFFLSSLGFIAMLQTHHNLKNISIYPKYSASTFPGNDIKFHYLAKSEDNRIHAAIKTDTGHTFLVNKSTETTFSIKEKAVKRGKQVASKFKLYSEFPLGLFHAWTQVQLHNQVIIYPKPVKYELKITNFNQGNQQSTLSAGDDDFSGVRDFIKGDSPKSMAWKTIARTSQLYTKEFTAETSDTLIFDIDSLQHTNNTEEKISILCDFILNASKEKLTYGLKLNSTLISPGHGAIHRHKCLTTLAMYQQ